MAMDAFQSGQLRVQRKPDHSLVTDADEQVELAMRNTIATAFPDDGILGEEYGETPGTSGWRWLIDPIDGTRSFVHGVPLFGTLVAVETNTECPIGVIHMPALDEMVYAVSGDGAWHRVGANDPVPARVSATSSLESSLVCVTAISHFAKTDTRAVFDQLAERFGVMRGWSDCYAHVLVATGRADAVVEPFVNAWDIAPSIPIMTEAGGRCTDWRGTVSAYSSHTVVDNGHLHADLVTMLSPHAPLAEIPTPEELRA